MRDFIYVPGFHDKVSDYVVVASPPEMDPKAGIVYYGGEAKILSRDEVAKEIERSRALVRSMQSQSRDIMPTETVTTNK